MPDVDERSVRFGDRERDTTSYERAENSGVLVGRKTGYLFTVSYFGSDDDHLTLLYRDGGEWRGGCDCERWHYDGRQTGRPCAHLWAVKRAAETIEDFGLADAADALTENITECPTCDRSIDGRTEPKAQVPAVRGTTQCRLLKTDHYTTRTRRGWHASPSVVSGASVPVPRVGGRRRSRHRPTPHLHLRTTQGGARTLYRTATSRCGESPYGDGHTTRSAEWHTTRRLCHNRFHLKRGSLT